MSEDELPQFDLAAMCSATNHFHDLFLSYVASGFTEAQALYLLGCLIGGAKQ